MSSYNFKKEEDVDEYLKNLGTEYRFGCFNEKKPEVCHLLGDYLESISKDFEKAVKIYKTNCDSSNFPRSCYKVGNYFVSGKGGMKKSAPKALEYYEKGCEGNEYESCFRGGIVNLLEARRQNKDSKSKEPSSEPDSKNSINPASISKGINLLTKGCEGKNVDSCFNLSGIYMDGEVCGNETVKKDMKKAFEYSLKSCNLGSMYACSNVSIMYRKGDGVEKSLDKSENYKKLVMEMKTELENVKGIQFQQGLN